jgi:hypothetical protein
MFAVCFVLNHSSMHAQYPMYIHPAALPFTKQFPNICLPQRYERDPNLSLKAANCPCVPYDKHGDPNVIYKCSIELTSSTAVNKQVIGKVYYHSSYKVFLSCVLEMFLALKTSVFKDIAPCSLVDVYRSFGTSSDEIVSHR